MAAVLKQLKQFCTLENLTEILRGRTCLRNFAKLNPSIRSLPRSHASPHKQTFCCYPYTRGYCTVLVAHRIMRIYISLLFNQFKLMVILSLSFQSHYHLNVIFRSIHQRTEVQLQAHPLVESPPKR